MITGVHHSKIRSNKKFPINFMMVTRNKTKPTDQSLCRKDMKIVIEPQKILHFNDFSHMHTHSRSLAHERRAFLIAEKNKRW